MVKVSISWSKYGNLTVKNFSCMERALRWIKAKLKIDCSMKYSVEEQEQ